MMKILCPRCGGQAGLCDCATISRRGFISMLGTGLVLAAAPALASSPAKIKTFEERDYFPFSSLKLDARWTPLDQHKLAAAISAHDGVALRTTYHPYAHELHYEIIEDDIYMSPESLEQIEIDIA